MMDLHDIAGVKRLRRALRLDPIHLKRLRRAFYKHGRSRAEAPAFASPRARQSSTFVL